MLDIDTSNRKSILETIDDAAEENEKEFLATSGRRKLTLRTISE